MPVKSCADNFLGYNIDFVESGILQVDPLDHLGVFARSWLDLKVRRRRGTASLGIGWQDPCQSDEEVKKDWIFAVVPVT